MLTLCIVVFSFNIIGNSKGIILTSIGFISLALQIELFTNPYILVPFNNVLFSLDSIFDSLYRISHSINVVS